MTSYFQFSFKMSNIILIFILCLLSKTLQEDEINYLSFSNNLGLELTEETYTTKDNYINSVWILESKTNNFRNGRSIILQHGFLDAGWTWLVQGTKSVPYLLANEGYVVYISHIRGTQFSHGHKKYSADNPISDYWDFSVDQMAEYDLPALLEFVKKRDGIEKVDYWGHSQGTLMYFLAYMNDPEYMEKSINKFAGVGTVPNLNNCPHPLIKLIDQLKLAETFPLKNVFMFSTEIGKYIKSACNGFAKDICISVLNVGLGKTGRIDYDKILEVLPIYEPGGTSIQNCRHWVQMYREKKLRKYDYGSSVENLKHYGSTDAPLYDLSKMNGYSIPSFTTTSDADPFCNPQDTLEFLQNIDNQDVFEVLSLKNYGHLDYIWTDDGYNEVLPRIIKFFDE